MVPLSLFLHHPQHNSMLAQLESPEKATKYYYIASPSRRALHDLQNQLPEAERDESWEHPELVHLDLANAAEGSITFTRDRSDKRHRTYRDNERQQRSQIVEMKQTMASMARQSAMLARMAASLSQALSSQIAQQNARIADMKVEADNAEVVETYEAMSAVIRAVNDYLFDIGRVGGVVLSAEEKKTLKRANLGYLTKLLKFRHTNDSHLGTAVANAFVIIAQMGNETEALVRYCHGEVLRLRDRRNSLQHPRPDAATVVGIFRSSAPQHVAAVTLLTLSNPYTLDDVPQPIFAPANSYLTSAAAVRQRLRCLELEVEKLSRHKVEQDQDTEAAEAEAAACEARTKKAEVDADAEAAAEYDA
ncbi:hypothetical protein C8J57DRAFT_1285595 [Mycena rebaudengoi]|nr:hypothetical protein C8J57DRAFT_1285595 [Mycena rebaudengoi]